MFPARPVRQVAALPFISLDDRIQILLITTRRRGRWSLPKGWPKKRLSASDGAAKEALEEAGVIGPMGEAPLGTFDYMKRMPEGYRVLCRVIVYPLLVTEHQLEWRESHQRAYQWVGLREAAALASERGLRRILKQLDDQEENPLASMAAEHVAKSGGFGSSPPAGAPVNPAGRSS